VLFLSESNNIENVWDTASLLQAIRAWAYLRGQRSLTPAVITHMHGMLMRHHNLRPEEKGAFRTGPVWIGGREGRPWYAVPALMEAWCERARAAQTAEQIRADHVQYEVIHPFVDGNGRTGRMVLNWQRLQVGLPILVIKEAEKREYYAWFR
jgi:Fic family protein